MNKYYPEDIAKALCDLVVEEYDITEKLLEECTEALEYLMALAENPLNRDCYRTLYNVLGKLTEDY